MFVDWFYPWMRRTTETQDMKTIDLGLIMGRMSDIELTGMLPTLSLDEVARREKLCEGD